MSQVPKAFFSYVRHDDDHDAGRLSRLRERLQGEIRQQTGLLVEIYQDVRELKWGDRWEQQVMKAVAGSLFLIPVITPGYFASKPCRTEYDVFKKRPVEGAILPIYYVETDEMSDPEARAGNRWAEEMAAVQWADWRNLRFEPWESAASKQAIVQMAKALKVRLKELGVLRRGSTASPTTAGEPAAGAASSARDASPRREIVVGADGSAGAHRTIAEAIRAASTDDLVLIRPGTYRESVVLEKSITLLGDGPRDSIIIEGAAGPGILFKARFGRVANLTIRRLQGPPEDVAVRIQTGGLELDGCVICSESKASVVVEGDSDPVLRRNTIAYGTNGGILICDTARGTIEDNDIFANRLAGISIIDHSKPFVRRNRIHDSVEGGGIRALAGGILEENDVFANALAGIELGEEADPIVRRNRVHDGNQSGILAHTRARGTIEDNDIVANANAGIAVREKANVIVRKNRIKKNGYEGIWVYQGAGGTFEENDLRDNKRGPWDIKHDSLPNVKRSGNIEE